MFLVNNEHRNDIIDVVLMSSFLILDRSQTFPFISNANFEQVIVCWTQQRHSLLNQALIFHLILQSLKFRLRHV